MADKVFVISLEKLEEQNIEIANLYHMPVGSLELMADFVLTPKEAVEQLNFPEQAKFNPEEYQCVYHEYMLRFFEKRPFMWATHLWNMFDFAADARNQGGEPGMNHKGLVTFDRKTKKDSFYLYKAWWSKEPFVYITGRRYVDRAEKKTTVKVYSNCPEVTLYVNGEKFATQTGNKVFRFRVPLRGEVEIKAVASEQIDKIHIRHTKLPNLNYKLGKKIAGGGNWT